MTENEDVKKKTDSEVLDDEALEKLAVEELMREAVQGAARAEIVGPSGWVKSQPRKVNKRFLVNTLRDAVSSSRYYNPRRPRRDSKSPSPPKRSRESSLKKEKSKRKH